MNKKKLTILKIGGNVINDPSALEQFLCSAFKPQQRDVILVHGGGKLLNTLAEKTGVVQQIVNGRRITDAETLHLATMVYGGSINKQIVSLLQARSIDAIGLTGADGNSISAQKRVHPDMDYGFVGDILPDGINVAFISGLLEQGLVPVFCSITHDGEGQLLNTNADSVAGNMASAFAKYYEVHLVFCFEKNGVLQDPNDENSVIPEISENAFQSLVQHKIITGGMLPKIENAIAAKKTGVQQVTITSASHTSHKENTNHGTRII